MNLIICDDEPLFLESVEQKIKQWGYKNGHSSAIMTHCFTSGEDMLEAWQNGLQVDVLFLDIQIPGEMSGLAVAREIYEQNKYIPIVFITGYSEYAEEGYIVNALRYLRKPVSEKQISECMEVIWRRWLFQCSDCIAFDLPTQVLRLPVNAVLYAEVFGHYCTLHTT